MKKIIFTYSENKAIGYVIVNEDNVENIKG